MAYDSRTDRAKVTWERKTERAKRHGENRVKRQATKSAARHTYRKYGEYDA